MAETPNNKCEKELGHGPDGQSVNSQCLDDLNRLELAPKDILLDRLIAVWDRLPRRVRESIAILAETTASTEPN